MPKEIKFKKTDDNDNLQAIITRNALTQSATASVFAMHEEHIRTKTLTAIETPLLKVGLAQEFPHFMPSAANYDNMLLLHNIGVQELEKLHKTSTPIGKAGLPTMVNMWEYPEVMNHIFKQEYKEAMYLFRDQYVKKVGLSDPLLDRLKYSGWALGITATGISAYQIAKSDNRIEETIHQTALFTGGLTGALEAGALAIGPCSVLSVWAPICVAGASCAGSIIGTEIGEQLYQAAKAGKFSALLSPKAHAAVPIKPAILSSFSTKNTFLTTYAKDFNFPQINTYLDNFRDSQFKNPLMPKKKKPTGLKQDLAQTLKESWWFAPAEAKDSLSQLTQEISLLDYTTKIHGSFFTSENRATLFNTHNKLQLDLNAYTPKANEAQQYTDLQNQLNELKPISQHLRLSDDELMSDLDPKLQNLFDPSIIKTPEELAQAYKHLLNSDAPVVKNPRSETDERVLLFLEGHYESTLECSKQLENEGRFSLELGRIAYAMKNPGLGQGLTIMGATAQGTSAAVMFQAATGAAAIGYAAGVVGASAMIISTLTAQDSGIDEAFQATHQAIRQSTQLILEKLSELMKFCANFRDGVYERFSIYFGALYSEVLHSREMQRNTQKHILYQAELTRKSSDATLSFLEDEVLYEVRSYYDGTRDPNGLTYEKAEEYLSGLRLRLDKSMSSYESGVDICFAKQRNGNMAAIADINEMLQNPEKSGQLFGFVACLYQMKKWLTQVTPIINPNVWIERVTLYVFMRQIIAHKKPKESTTKHYDLNFSELQHVIKQAEAFVQFINNVQNGIILTQDVLFAENKNTTQTLLDLFKYSENAHKLFQQYPIPSFMREVIHSLPNIGSIDIPNEFFVLEALGLGKFEIHKKGCIGPRRDLEYVRRSREGNLNDVERANSIIFVYNNGARVVLAYTFAHPDSRCELKSIDNEWKNKVFSEARENTLNERRKFSKERQEVLEKQLEPVCETINDNEILIKSSLTVAGVPASMISLLPHYTCPQELAPLIAIYRMDQDHSDLYRALPYPQNTTDALQKYTQNWMIYFGLLFDTIKNKTNDTFFFSREKDIVSLKLMQLYRLQTELVFLNNTSSSTSEIENNTAIINPTLQSLQKKLDELALAYNQRAIELQAERQETQELKSLLKELIGHLKLNQPAAGMITGAAGYEMMETGQCYALSPDKMLCLLDNDYNYRTRLVQRLPFVNTPINEITNDLYSSCTTDRQYCLGKQTEFVEQILPVAEPNLVSSALYGAATTAIPEAIGDLAELYGDISYQQAQDIKNLVNTSFTMLLLCLSNEKNWFWGMLAIWLTTQAVKKWAPESNATIIGNTVGFLVNSGGQVTSTNIKTAAATYLAGYAGLFAEKYVLKQLRAYRENSDKITQQKTL